MTVDLDRSAALVTAVLRSTVRDAGYRRGIVGLTGRTDEAVVATLAVEALTAKQVRLLVLVDPEEEGDDPAPRARAVAAHLDVEVEEIPLDAYLEVFFAEAPEANPRRRRGFLARLRTALLLDRSVSHRALVLGTANKSERLLGRCHLYGEDACSIDPVGDLYATEVEAMADRLGVPAEARGPATVVELRASSVQGGKFEPTYAWIDPLLRRLYDDRLRRRQLMKMGYERADIHRVSSAVRRSRYRRRGPVIPAVSARPV